MERQQITTELKSTSVKVKLTRRGINASKMAPPQQSYSSVVSSKQYDEPVTWLNKNLAFVKHLEELRLGGIVESTVLRTKRPLVQ